MIIWSGWGFMVAFGLSLATELGVEAYFGDNRYYQTQRGPWRRRFSLPLP